MNYNDDDSINNPDIDDLRAPSEGRIPNFPGQPPVFPGKFTNVPGGSNLNIGAPPNFTPTKSSPGVQSLNQPGGQSKGGPQTKAVSPGSISFCLFKFTYIWERRGRNYWAYLLNVDRRSISGLRWFRGTWVFFGLDLRQIDSFVCFRNSISTLDSDDLREDSSETNTLTHNNNLFFTKKEYSVNTLKNTYVRILKNIDIPEERNEYITSYIGEVEDNELTIKIPTNLHRNTSYRIILELKYPEKFSEGLIADFNKCANEAADNILDVLDEYKEESRILTPLDVFTNSTKNIGKAVKSFSEEFHKKLKNFKLPREITRQIEFRISEEKISSPWI